MTPLQPINIDTLKEDTKENMQLEQMKASHLGAMQLLDDPGSPLYAEPLSMGEYGCQTHCLYAFMILLSLSQCIGEGLSG